MEPDSIVILLPGECYKMQLLGGEKPRIRIVLDRTIDQALKSSLGELSLGFPKIEIAVSTDGLFNDDRRSVAVSILAKATHALLEMCNCVGDLPAVCSINFKYQPETADRFFRACRGWIDSGNRVPVTIVDSAEKVLCVFQAETIIKYSWAEKMQTFETTAMPSVTITH